MNGLRTRFATAWEHLVAVQAGDEEEARLGRLFNTMMVISTGIVIALSIAFLLMPPLGLLGARLSWTAAAFPLAFIPLSVFCLARARRGHIRPMILLYVWGNLIAVGAAAWLFGGVYSPAWLLFFWTVIAAHEFDKCGQLTVSFGVAELEPPDDLNSLLKRVDDALYRAKALGRNRVEILTGEMASK